MNDAEAGAQVQVLDHPLGRVGMTTLRDENTPPWKFRQVLHQISAALAWFALRDMPTETQTVRTPLMETTGWRLQRSLVLVPILRAGLGFAESMLAVLPDAEMGHIGLARDEMTHRPAQYYCKLPRDLQQKEVLLLDPMLATGRSAAAGISLLKEAGARQVRFIALVGCPEGVATLRQAHPEIPIYLAALDQGLNAQCYILPGLGDAGDRYFGTL